MILDKETRCLRSNREAIPGVMERGTRLGDELSCGRSKCHNSGTEKEIPQILRMYGISIYERLSPSRPRFFSLQNRVHDPLRANARKASSLPSWIPLHWNANQGSSTCRSTYEQSDVFRPVQTNSYEKWNYSVPISRQCPLQMKSKP